MKRKLCYDLFRENYSITSPLITESGRDKSRLEEAWVVDASTVACDFCSCRQSDRLWVLIFVSIPGFTVLSWSKAWLLQDSLSSSELQGFIKWAIPKVLTFQVLDCLYNSFSMSSNNLAWSFTTVWIGMCGNLENASWLLSKLLSGLFTDLHQVLKVCKRNSVQSLGRPERLLYLPSWRCPSSLPRDKALRGKGLCPS